MKYLFLDIDGVLNHEEWFEKIYKDPNYTKSTKQWFDPNCVKRVNEILKNTGAKLVISSSWRFDKDLKNIFKLVGLPTEYDITPDFGHDVQRGYEIQKYLMDKFDKNLNYCILDDDEDFFDYQKKNFIQIAGTYADIDLINENNGTGLTESVMLKAITILNK